ncbi:hypothetical protein KAX97_14670 [candidate division WOR-3 bacterium]|nr:hypothetical protein [candidate division WOR-3 bacterium]
MRKNNNKYNVLDEYNRIIEFNVSLKRAQDTKKLEPMARIKKILTSGNAGKGGNDEH